MLVRFLGLSLAVALGAVIATAVIATYSTSEKLQGEIDANTGQLQVDGQIYAELSKYAADHPTWSGVDKLVHDLADELGRRIAVTDPDGTVIADSARMLGAGPELPSVPAATIDARNEGTRSSPSRERYDRPQDRMPPGKANDGGQRRRRAGALPGLPGLGADRRRNGASATGSPSRRSTATAPKGKTATVSTVAGGGGARRW